jgi:hypothetical protein
MESGWKRMPDPHSPSHPTATAPRDSFHTRTLERMLPYQRWKRYSPTYLLLVSIRYTTSTQA